MPLGLVMGVCALVNPIPPAMAPSPFGVTILWLVVLVDSLLHALVFYYVNIGGGGGDVCARAHVCMREKLKFYVAIFRAAL